MAHYYILTRSAEERTTTINVLKAIGMKLSGNDGSWNGCPCVGIYFGADSYQMLSKCVVEKELIRTLGEVVEAYMEFRKPITLPKPRAFKLKLISGEEVTLYNPMESGETVFGFAVNREGYFVVEKSKSDIVSCVEITIYE